MIIPHTLDRRSDTGVNNVTLGIWLFLASEVMLFGALFSAYALLRVSAPAWPIGRDVLSLPLGATNTVILLAMSGLAWRARSGDVRMARRLLGASTICALAFLGVKAFEWQSEISHGLLPSVNTFLALYFTLTGLHALHVVSGVVANTWTITGVRRVGEAMTIARVRNLSLYWAFVDVVWLIIFSLMYVS
jgi:cytochrome c oxidase subunit 3